MTAQALAHHTNPAAEIFDTLVRERKSVRAFRPDPVPRELIEHLLELCGQSASNCNTQPWRVEIVSGETKAALSAALWADAQHMQTSADIPYLREHYPEDFVRRQIDHTQCQYDTYGISREDMAGRMGILQRNMNFFGAPHTAMLLMPAFGNEREAADLGLFAQTFMLALTAHGLASVPQTAVGLFAGPIRRVLGYPDDHQLLFALSFGYEDSGNPEARLEQEREPLTSWVRFHH
jgi:nitroreductase